MPKIIIEERELEKIYKRVKRETSNFRKIDPEILAKNPKNILVFRFLIGMGLVNFGKLLDKTYATISQYERGNIKSIPINESRRITSIIEKELSQDLTLHKLITNFRKYKELAKGGSVQAFMAAEKAKPTEQEQKIIDFLEKEGIEYETNKTCETSIGLLNFDFWIPKKRIMIECTESVYKEKAESLGFRIIKLKEKLKCKGIAIVKENVSNGVKRRLVDYDHIIFSSNLNDLKSLLK